jgi:uncharacterized protein (TIGR00255 family)
MISMTGYAYKEKSGQELSISAEIKGFNNRYLEISVNLPPWLSMLETKIREKITSNCGRGKVDIFIRVREHNTPVNISVNKNAAKAYYNAINEMAKELGMKEKPSLSTILGMESVLEIEKNRDDERYWREIEPLMNDAVKSF